jgi:Formin N-terminal GTPase-binding domain
VVSGEVSGRVSATNMAFMQCRIQYLDDTDPFNSTNFPEPTRPPTYTFLTSVPLINQIAGVKKLLNAPHRVSTICLSQVLLINVVHSYSLFA